jgi:ABC-2 type transport system ATP-binding protein
MGDQAAIEATGLEKSFGDVRVLDGVAFRVEPGMVFSLLGPNGSGKTTTVRILSTLTRPDRGRARVAGFDVVGERHEVRRRISLTGQYAAVDERQTGEENLVMIARLSSLGRRGARRRALNLLAEFDLMDVASRQVSTYSGGMRRRLDLAVGLVGRPAVIFLDEPTTGLDLPSRQAMWQVISATAAEGAAIFLTTQYLEEADLLADRNAVLDHGRVVAEGTSSELKTRGAPRRLDIVFVDERAFVKALQVLGDRVVYGDRALLAVGVESDGTAAHVRFLLDEIDPDNAEIADFALHQTNLDDVFLALTGRAPVRPAEAAAGV